MPNNTKLHPAVVRAKAKGRAAEQAAKAKDKAEELKKSIMDMHLTHKPLKDQGLAG
jgi:hypothetical protein